EYRPATVPSVVDPLPGDYASWEEFRAMSPAVQRERVDLATRALPNLRDMTIDPIPESVADTDADLGSPLASVTLYEDNPRGRSVNVLRVLFAAVLFAALLLIAL